MTTIAPTPERLAKGGIQSAAVNQKEKREYHRHLDLFHRCYKQKTISYEQLLAADKLDNHYKGSLGHDARMTDEFTREMRDLDGIPPIFYHGEKINKARSVVPFRQWQALLMALDGTDDLAIIGRVICQRKDRSQASAAALVLIQEGLDVLSVLWGFQQNYRPPSR
jgi:hypothetical protein